MKNVYFNEPEHLSTLKCLKATKIKLNNNVTGFMNISVTLEKKY